MAAMRARGASAREAERVEAGLDILQHRQPGEERKGLEHHGDALGRAR